MSLWFAVPLSLSFAAAAWAEPHEHRHHQPEPAAPGQDASSPYAGLQDRSIKALSAEHMADLRAGRGMGLALPAELNGYPGPLHVLELAGPLGLEPGQLQQARQWLASMKVEAQALGEELIAAETGLDHLFRDGLASADNVAEATARAARVQGRLRASHLKYHLAMKALLTPAQVAQYNRLRGYRP
jgi:hypothetical protein